MTEQQAGMLMAQLVSAFPANKATEDTIDLYIEYLVPLPYERTQRAVVELLATARFFPTIAEVVEAAGVEGADGRQQLLAAMAGKQQLVRDAASATGWAIGRAVLPPDQIPPARPALPAGPVVGEAERRSLKERLKALARGLTGGTEAVEW